MHFDEVSERRGLLFLKKKKQKDLVLSFKKEHPLFFACRFLFSAFCLSQGACRRSRSGFVFSINFMALADREAIHQKPY